MCTYKILSFYIYGLKCYNIFYILFIWDKGTAFRCDALQRPYVYQFFVRRLTTLLKLFSFRKALIRRAGRDTHRRRENRNTYSHGRET